MKRWRTSEKAAGAALFGAALAALAWPAISQEAPESILPPGFSDPVAPPAPANGGGAPAAVPGAPTDLLPSLALAPEDNASAEDPLVNSADMAEAADEIELPSAVRRSVEEVGPLLPENGGLGFDAWGSADGRFLTGLMRRTEAPVASRWASILLRRALISRVAAPGGVDPVDWVAERAWLLLRMGEADAARMLVQGVDAIRYTPRLYAVAQQVALATADPTALCPIADKGAALSREPSWPLAQAICAGLSGDPGVAGALIDHVRGTNAARGIDLLLAEKVVGAGTNGRRAINIEWAGVYQLTAWRFGLANAVGVAVPDSLYQSAGPQVRAWAARAPLASPESRITNARVAARLGVFSNGALVSLYAALADGNDALEDEQTPAARLRTAYRADTADRRVAALRSFWGEAADPGDLYAAQILTAAAAARVIPNADYATDTASLLAAMLSAGFDRPAERWAAVVADGGDGADQAWALLATGARRAVVDIGPARVAAYIERSGLEHRHRAQLLLGALAGLNRLAPAEAARIGSSIGLDLPRETRWSRMLELAVRSRQPATVALIASVGLQNPSWRAIPGEHLYRIVSALRRVGLEPEARMIAAEAVSRA